MSTDRATLSDFTDDTDYVRRINCATGKIHEDDGDGNPACQMGKVNDDGKWIEAGPEEVEDGEKCQYCFGDVERRDNPGPSRAAEWSRMDPEDLGMAPMGERR